MSGKSAAQTVSGPKLAKAEVRFGRGYDRKEPTAEVSRSGTILDHSLAERTLAKYSWKEVVEGIGVLSIVASLVFVGLQIKQEQEIARAQLGSETSELVSSIYLTMTEPGFASAYSKMLQHPKQMTPKEMIQVNGLLSSVAEMLFRECYLFDRDVFVECDSFIQVHGERFFGNKYAQSWWRHNRPPSLFGLGNQFDTVISGFDVNSSRQSLESVQAEM